MGAQPDRVAQVVAWQPSTVATWQDWRWKKYHAFERDFNGPWFLAVGQNILFSDPMLQVVMAHAQAIEAGEPFKEMPDE